MIALAESAGVPISDLDASAVVQRDGFGRTQGVELEVGPIPEYEPLEQLVSRKPRGAYRRLVALLDRVEDPSERRLDPSGSRRRWRRTAS